MLGNQIPFPLCYLEALLPPFDLLNDKFKISFYIHEPSLSSKSVLCD